MRSKAFAIGLCLLGFATAAFAQQQVAFEVRNTYPRTPEETPFAVHRQVAEVAVQLSVHHRSGKPVTELQPDDLEVLDSGMPAAITELRREGDLPLRIAVVIDWSDSMQKSLQFERQVALDFLRNVLRPETDQAMVVGFRYRVEVTQPLTSNLQSLEAGLRPVAGVPLSSVYDALIAATDSLQDADPYPAQRRAIVLLSDGRDNVSAHGLADVIEAAAKANITVYTITPMVRQEGPARGREVMTQLARITGGQAFSISRASEQAAFAAIRRDLSTGYALYFKPRPGSGGLRPLQINARDKNFQVVARHGYYAGWE